MLIFDPRETAALSIRICSLTLSDVTHHIAVLAEITNSQASRRFFPALVSNFCGDVHLGPSTFALLLKHDTLHARHGHVAQGAV